MIFEVTNNSEVIPLEARDFYENLTSTDRQVLEKVLTKAPKYASFGEVLGGQWMSNVDVLIILF